MENHAGTAERLPSARFRIIYGCPSSNTPSGGVKVIYRHAALLNSMGCNAFVWHPGSNEFSCDWFTHSVRSVRDEELSPSTDLIVVPEIWASSQVQTLKDMGFKVCIYVQNAYMTHVNLSPDRPDAISRAYSDSDLILSISKDNSLYIKNILKVPLSKIILQRYAIDQELFRPANKEKLITYMPRKMAQHSVRVVSALESLLPEGWSVQAIDKMTEKQVAAALSRSIIFLAFSEFEGLPVPPVEAALSGNLVIGYHGQGGREYWNSPNFINIDQGDIQGFVSSTLQAVAQFEAGDFPLEQMNVGIRHLSEYFSSENEMEFLKEFARRAVHLYS